VNGCILNFGAGERMDSGILPPHAQFSNSTKGLDHILEYIREGTTAMLNGYDIDGVILPNRHGNKGGVKLEPPCVIISGRTLDEYSKECKLLASCYPVYIRGIGDTHNEDQSIEFKAMIINYLGVTTFHEDRPKTASALSKKCPNTRIILHTPNGQIDINN
jgi:hypothetical protein